MWHLFDYYQSSEKKIKIKNLIFAIVLDHPNCLRTFLAETNYSIRNIYRFIDILPKFYKSVCPQAERSSNPTGANSGTIRRVQFTPC
jgi:hypothetical protein